MMDFVTMGFFEWSMLLVAAIVFLLFLHIFNHVPKADRLPPSMRACLSLLTAWAVVYGGGKAPQGRVIVDDPYIEDAGSYLTNDVVHVAIGKRSAMLPDNTAILVYARQLEQTNATDWVRLTPHLKYVDHPHDYSLTNATNYNVMVAAQFSPSPTVHTNGVWYITGFIIPNSGGKMGFKQTRLRLTGFHATNPPTPIFEEEDEP